MAVQTTLPPATLYTSGELSLHHLRPVRADGGLLIAQASTVHLGRSLAVSEAVVSDAHGRVVARAASRCHVMPPLDLPADLPDEPWAQRARPSDDPYRRPVAGGPVPLPAWEASSGIDILDAQQRGSLPASPLHRLTGIQVRSWSEGCLDAAMGASPWLAAPHANVHGGALCLLAYAAIAGAVQTTVPTGFGFATVDAKTSFLRPVATDDQTLTARANVVRRGRTTAIATAEIIDAAGKTVVLSTGTAVVLERPFHADFGREAQEAA